MLEQPKRIQRRGLLARAVCFSALLLLLGSALLAPATASASTWCTIHGFSARVFQGPTRGMVLTGNISLRLDSDGSLKGTLLSTDRQVEVNLTGHTREQSIFWEFDMGYSGSTEASLFGLGALRQPFTDCSTTMAGLFIGPQSGDRGVWYVPGS